MRGTIVQLAKAPVPGDVKTRMQPTLSPVQSAQLHRALVEHCHQQVQDWVCTRADTCHLLAVSPIDHPYWQQQFPGSNYWPQPTGDLGARMQALVVDTLLQQKQDWVILIGSDCPDLSATYLEQAVRALTITSAESPTNGPARLVIGPAEDGGYVLIGMNAPLPLFSGVDWGSAQVLSQTICLAASAGVDPVLLPSLPDIDRPEDLVNLAPWQNLAPWVNFSPL